MTRTFATLAAALFVTAVTLAAATSSRAAAACEAAIADGFATAWV